MPPAMKWHTATKCRVRRHRKFSSRARKPGPQILPITSLEKRFGKLFKKNISMQSDRQQWFEGYPMFCAECHMYDYMPLGQKSWVCPRFKKLQELREWVCFFEVLVVDWEKQRQGKRDRGETSRDLQASSHPQTSNSSSAGIGSLRAGRWQSGQEGNYPLGGDPFFKSWARIQLH